MEIIRTIRTNEGNDFLISVSLSLSSFLSVSVDEIIQEILSERLVDIINLDLCFGCDSDRESERVNWTQIDRIHRLCHQYSSSFMITVRGEREGVGGGELLRDDLIQLSRSCDLIASTNPFPSHSISNSLISSDESDQELSKLSLLISSQLENSNLFRLPFIGFLFFQEYRHYLISQIVSSPSPSPPHGYPTPSLAISWKVGLYLFFQVIHNTIWCPRKERRLSTLITIYWIACLISSGISVLFVGWILNELSK